MLTHIVTPGEDGLPLSFLLRDVLCLSAREVRQAKAEITVDSKPRFLNQCVHTCETIRVPLARFEPRALPYRDDLPPVRVLYEDDALVAVYKPALLQSHPSPSAKAGTDTLQERVCAQLKAEAHAVHRLDAETTGIVLFAKLPYVQARLQRQMETGEFAKEYEALIFGVPSPAEGIIDAPIAPVSPDSFTRVVCADGQRAVSRYRVLEAFPIADAQHASRVLLSPLTGRTHQLRVHMAHIGCPLLGDTRYYTESSQAASAVLGVCYHQLAAVRLRFVHPLTGETIKLHCPDEFSPIFPRIA